jgi:dTDP-glucose 4,6-dehydratase
MKIKVLITGGLGFIFSHVTEYFVSKGYDVVVIDNETVGSHPEIIDGSFTYFKDDVFSKESYDFIVKHNPDYIIHAAAISDVDFSIQNPNETIYKNNQSIVNVFEAARKCSNLKKLVYISTDEVYGECEYRKQETDIIFPKNPYACSKAFGSLLRITYDNTYPELKDKTAETRFCNVFGERQDDRKIMSAIKESILNDKIIPIHNGGKGSREYIYIGNIPEAVELVMLKGNRVYNITLNDSYTVTELIDKVQQVTSKKVNTVESQRSGMDLKYQMDNSRILELGWKPKFTFEEGIKKYYEII